MAPGAGATTLPIDKIVTAIDKYKKLYKYILLYIKICIYRERIYINVCIDR